MSDSVRPHRQQPTRLLCPWDSPGKNTGVGCHFLLQCMKMKSESEVAQSCPTLSDPMDCSLPGSSIHGIFQARVLEWGAIASPDNPRDLDRNNPIISWIIIFPILHLKKLRIRKTKYLWIPCLRRQSLKQQNVGLKPGHLSSEDTVLIKKPHCLNSEEKE